MAMPRRYSIRVIRYFLYLAGVFVAVSGLLALLGYASWSASLSAMCGDARGVWFALIVFVALPLAYPFWGYGSLEMDGHFDELRKTIDKSLKMSGYYIAQPYP